MSARRITLHSVIHTTFRSVASVRWSTYHTSSRKRSAHEIALRPWHWAQPVQDVAPGQLWLGNPSQTQPLSFDLVCDLRGTGARPAVPVRGVRGEVVWLHAPGLRLQRQRPKDHARFERVLRCIPVYGCPDNTMVVDLEEEEGEKYITAMNRKDGILTIRTKAIILAMGCGPLLAWKRADLLPALQRLWLAGGVAVLVFLVLSATRLSQAPADAPGAVWTEVPYLSSSAMTAGVMELTYRLEDFAAERLRLRITLHGSFNARPWATNLRTVVL